MRVSGLRCGKDFFPAVAAVFDVDEEVQLGVYGQAVSQIVFQITSG